MKTLVIANGLSDEKDVSLRSAQNVLEALKALGKEAEVLVFDSASKIAELEKEKIEKAILVSHGKFGEDGCLQGLLELLKIPYSGSNLYSSALCMNKIKTKELLASHELPVLATWTLSEITKDDVEHVHAVDRLPNDASFIVKPISEGSSVGMFKVSSLQELKEISKKESLNAKEYFIEPFISGIELTASIIPASAKLKLEKLKNIDELKIDDDLISLPLLELRSKNEFYDYEAKYTPGLTEFILPAEIETELKNQIHSLALKAYRAAGCKDFARVDFLIDNNQPYILEINTLPGMTNTSDLPAQAKAAGIEFKDLVELMV